MPTHGCIACPYRQAWCCICAGHQHALYGPSGLPPDPAARTPFVAADDAGVLSDNPSVGFVGIDPAYPAHAIYFREDVLGQTRMFIQVNGEEREVVTVPAVPANPPPAEPEPASGPTLWEHLAEDD